jgi:hypothetical protein
MYAVPLLLGTMGISLNLELKFSHTIDEPNAMEIVLKRLSRPPKKVIQVLGVVGVTQWTLRKST